MADVDFRVLVDTMPDVIAVLDRDRRYVYANAALDEIAGMPLAGTRNDDIMPPEDAARWRDVIADVLATGDPRELDCVLPTPRGLRVFESVVTRVSADHVCVVTHDVTDYRAVLEAERHAREHAEQARERTRRIHELTTALSTAIERDEVISTMVDVGRAAVGAAAGFAWMLRDHDTLELAAVAHDAASQTTAHRLDAFRTLPVATPIPVCDVIRTGEPLLFENLDAMVSAFPAAQPGPTPYRAWAVMPFVAGGRSIGAVSFSFATERTFSVEDRALLVTMTGHAALALERCRLIESERRARSEAERARLRQGQLHVIAARLSSALTQEQVATIACQESVAFVGAMGGGLSIRDGDDLVLLSTAGESNEEQRRAFTRAPLALATPTSDALRAENVVWCASEAELDGRYPHLESMWRARGVRSWGAIPFSFGSAAIGALAIAYSDERELARDDRAFLHAVGQLAGQALERARLHDAHRASEERLRFALSTARAATWSVDLATGTSVRDDSYRDLVGQHEASGAADFMSIHPEDRHIAQDSFQRTLAEGVPYEPEVRVRRDDGTYMWIRAHGRLVHGPDGKPSTLAGVVVDIDEAKRASLRADEERRFNDELHRLTQAFAAELDHDRLVQLITSEATALLGGEVGALFIEDATVTAGDASLADELRGAVSARVRSTLAVALSTRSGHVEGKLVVGHTEPGRFTEHHLRLLVGVASHASVALENARLYKAVREQKEQLEVAVERARAADRRKDEFLAMLGHELRNPLAPIATALDLMELREGAETKERAVIRRQVAHMSRLIEDLLDVSRITRGKVQLVRQSIEIAVVLAKAVELASPLLEKRMHRLTIDVPRAGLVVDADATRLAQVFQNLLTNAAKYSDVRSHIALSAHVDGEQVVVEVRDHGIGIGPELLPRLFDLFVQGERTLDRSEGGLGIGLTIARSLCELHGGTIAATSTGLGHGSTFSVRLPRVTAASSGIEDTRARRQVTELGNPWRVLVVDDNVDAAHMLRDFLEALGHEPAIAHDGPAALELATSFAPHIAVLDIGLPVMNGYEVARRLREQHGPDTLKLIAVTGYGQEADRARAREVGFDHHLIKPIELDALLALLAK